MISEGLGEMFEGDYADMCPEKFPLVSMGRGKHADPRARNTIGTIKNTVMSQLFVFLFPPIV
jgi:hypothetical protein